MGGGFHRESLLPTPDITLGKFLYHQTSIPLAAICFLFLGSASRPVVIFDASGHFPAPSPDAAFAINMSEEFLADSAQQDCTFLPTQGLSRGTGLSAMSPRPSSCQEGLRQVVWLLCGFGGSFSSLGRGEDEKAEMLSSHSLSPWSLAQSRWHIVGV